jgi:site-specific DNA recombinase
VRVPRRAGLYLRISKDRSGEGLAVDRQRTDGLRLIEQRGWTLHREYVDNDISASGRKRRPSFDQMLADLQAGNIDVVVALSLDRLSRNRREQLHLMEICQEQEALIALVRGADYDLSTAIGRAVVDMMAVPARLEIEQKSERHIDQIRQAAEMGRMVGGRRAFGYTPDGLHLNVDEAPLLAQMYDRFLSGEPLGSLARWLNTAGVTTPRGYQWRPQTVREVLANPRNAAIRGMRPVVNKKTGSRSQWHVEIGPAVWPPAVPEETWRAAMHRIKDPLRPGNHDGVNSQKYLLTGIARCGVCDRPLIVGGTKTAGKDSTGKWRYRVLRCPSLRHISRRADYIEAFVEERVIGWFQGPGRVADPAVDGEDVDLEAVRSESTTLRARLRGLAGDYADGVLDRDGMRVAGDRIRARLSELDEQIAATGRVDVTAPLRAAEDPAEVWDALDLSMQREVLRRIAEIRVLPGTPGRLHGLRFHPDSVEIRWLR